MEQNVSGSIEEDVKQDHKIEFEFGNAIDTKRETYKFKSVPKPEILKFNAKTTEIKFDEKLTLNWEGRNFKEAKPIVDQWVAQYNQDRPHQSLNYETPQRFYNRKDLLKVA